MPKKLKAGLAALLVAMVGALPLFYTMRLKIPPVTARPLKTSSPLMDRSFALLWWPEAMASDCPSLNALMKSMNSRYNIPVFYASFSPNPLCPLAHIFPSEENSFNSKEPLWLGVDSSGFIQHQISIFSSWKDQEPLWNRLLFRNKMQIYLKNRTFFGPQKLSHTKEAKS